MMLRNRLAEADGVVARQAKLPSAVTLTIVPLVVYAIMGYVATVAA